LIVEEKAKKKTVLRTIRIDKNLDDALDKDAEEHGVSENALVSSILAKYIEWDRYAEKTLAVICIEIDFLSTAFVTLKISPFFLFLLWLL
jgi:hypothetical protein